MITMVEGIYNNNITMLFESSTVDFPVLAYLLYWVSSVHWTRVGKPSRWPAGPHSRNTREEGQQTQVSIMLPTPPHCPPPIPGAASSAAEQGHSPGTRLKRHGGVHALCYKLFTEVFKHPHAFNFKPWELNMRSESGKKQTFFKKMGCDS